jgi:hypothetical protein
MSSPAWLRCCSATTSVGDGMLELCLKNNPQVAGEIRAKNTYTTLMNTMELISFWCSKHGCIFLLYSSTYIDLLHEK